VSKESVCEIRGVRVVRHYGDPVTEYRNAVNSVAIRDRSHRGRIRVEGKAPLVALQGVLTGSMPTAPIQTTTDCWKGKRFYSAVLTPKARVITDLQIMWGSRHSQPESLFLDVPYIGMTPFMEYLRKTVPPRLAIVEDISEVSGLLSFVGPESSSLVARLLLGSIKYQPKLNDLELGDYIVVNPSNRNSSDIRIVRMEEISGGGWDVYSSKENIEDLWVSLIADGIQAIGGSIWETLRVEGGVAAFGQDICDSNIFPETGLVEKAIDHSKGCYTGQEVIVRVRDRGRVNRLLCGFRFHGEVLPKVSEKLFVGDREVGWLTSIVQSPRAGGAIALGYLRQDLTSSDSITVGFSSDLKATKVPLDRDWLRFTNELFWAQRS